MVNSGLKGLRIDTEVTPSSSLCKTLPRMKTSVVILLLDKPFRPQSIWTVRIKSVLTCYKHFK